jgi:hypothetical protein
VFVPLEEDPEIGSKHAVGNNKTLLIVDSCGDGTERIICVKNNRKLKSKNKTSLCYTDQLYIY